MMKVRLMRTKCDVFRFAMTSIGLVCSIDPARAATLDEVIRPVRSLGGKCQSIDGEHGWSFQARSMYSQNLATTMDGTSTQPIEKKYESFQCDRQQLTVYMYRYSDDAQASSALEGAKILVWGGKRSNYHHPESIFTISNVLVVVSGSRPKFLADVIMKGAAAPTEKAR